ncbi:hypothetical protein V6N13_019793 [Hibiscus sabdariffa]|uniref:U-box domain-containing protein n=1 Tax=Hibiscus sabdariffa TaxID=183260 RepID=A0ABR2ERF2_9ROSI
MGWTPNAGNQSFPFVAVSDQKSWKHGSRALEISDTPTHMHLSFISNVDEIFEGVTDMLRNLNSYPRALKTGIQALFALCLLKQTRHKAVQAGAPETLIDRLTNLDKCEVERALATIELLCWIPSGCSAFASHALTLLLLVKTILKISDRATEYAAGAMMVLCSDSEQCQRDAVNPGVLT